MFCKFCGNELQVSSNFCTKCGMRVEETAPAERTPVQSMKQVSAQETVKQVPAQEAAKQMPPAQAVPPRRKNKLLILVCIAGTAAVVLIAALVMLISSKAGDSASDGRNPDNNDTNYAWQGGGGQPDGNAVNSGNSGEGQPDGNMNNSGNGGENQSVGNADNSGNGGNFGIDTTTALKPDEYYTSEKTGTTFTIPSEEGYAQISIDGVVNDVPARFYYNLPSTYLNCSRRVFIYIDGKPKNSEQYVIWSFSQGSKWETGGSYGFYDVCSSRDWVHVVGVYRHYYPLIDSYTSGVYTKDSDMLEYFDDASFQVISLTSDGLYDESLKCYFYLEISDDSSSHIIEGVANLRMEI